MFIVVTGATRGIGRAISLKFAEEGFDVLFCARDAGRVLEFEQELKSLFPDQNFGGYVADLGKKEDVIAFADFIKGRTDKIEVLVNNAGRFLPGGVLTEEEGTYEELMALNLGGAYHLTRRLVPLVTNAGAKPYIFNMCSTASFTAYVNGGSYCISKFALLGFSKVLREELKSKKIRVSSIMPGATFTDSWKNSGLSEERFMNVFDIARQLWATYSMSHGTIVEEIIMRPLDGDI